MTTKPKIQISRPTTVDFSSCGGSWPLYLDHVEDWAWQRNVFTNDELDAIIRLGESKELHKGGIHGPQADKYRNSHVRFMYPNSIADWVFGRLASAVAQTNSQFFQFDLTGFDQGLQFTRYEAPSQHYDWHIDKAFQHGVRKMSLSVQLSDPDSYKGGDLQLKFGKSHVTVPRERGLITFFPSYVLHRVTPVREGTRCSLVAWIAGPPFK